MTFLKIILKDRETTQNHDIHYPTLYNFAFVNFQLLDNNYEVYYTIYNAFLLLFLIDLYTTLHYIESVFDVLVPDDYNDKKMNV